MKPLLAVLLVCAAAGAQADERLWALLKQGGQVVLIRHAVTDPGVGDPPGFSLGDCRTQRKLSAAAPKEGKLIRVAGRIVIAQDDAPAAAEWTPVGRANEIYAAFADKASIRRSAGLVSMHGLYDFRRQDFTPEGRGLYSTVVLREYDCAARRVRLLSSIDFSGRMGEGTPVSTSDRPGRWEAVVAGGIDDAYLRVACGTE